MASVPPAGGSGRHFTGYTHDFYVRRVYGRNVRPMHDKDVMLYSSRIPLAARLACAKLASQPLVIAVERKRHGVDDPDPYRNLRGTRDQRLLAGRVLSVRFLRTPLDGASHRYCARFGGWGCISAMELPLPGLRLGVGRRQACAP